MELTEIDAMIAENEAKKKDLDLESLALKKIKKRLEKDTKPESK